MTLTQMHLAYALANFVEHAYFKGGLPQGVRSVIAGLVEAMQSGNVCSRPEDGQALGLLVASGAASVLVGFQPSTLDTPLVVDGAGRLYLNRFYDYERLIAARIRELVRNAPAPDFEALSRALEATRLAFSDNGAANEQKIAVATAMLNPVSVISGGPGTGKTYTIAQIVLALLALDPDMRIALATPTGKAASRLTQGLADMRERFEPFGSFSPQARTIHSLLHALRSETFDAIVVDEAGMVSLELMGRLFRSAKDTARFVLVGDKDQLASVDEGAVFAEMSASCRFGEPRREALVRLGFGPDLPGEAPGGLPPSVLGEATTWLTRTRRFDAAGGIARLAQATLAGEASQAVEILRSPSPGLAHAFFEDAASYRQALWDKVLECFAPYADLVRETDASRQAGCDALFEAALRNGVLVGLNEGDFGVEGLNAFVRRRLFADRPSSGERFEGEIILVTENDYANGLFNGDVGIVVSKDGSLAAAFRETAPGKTGFRFINPMKLGHVRSAFAITVHKSQGSEFENVLLALPEKSRLLTREYFYTGITRAKKTLTVFASEESVRTAIATRQERTGGFLDRLEEAFGD